MDNFKRSFPEGIPNMEELLITKPFPEYLQINETLNSLAQIRYGIKYPNLFSKYRLLGRYCYGTVYMFSVTNFPYRKSEVEEKFEELSSRSLNGKEILLCRINEASPEWNNVQQDKTACLYIGKAEHIHETIKKHLFLYSAKTHALHLEKWLDPKLTITIDMWGFHAPLHGKNPGYLQTIEDFLWKRYEPLFGRQKNHPK